MTPALLIIVAFVLGSAAVGTLAARRTEMNLERWTVAGRGFGVIFVWLLMAGEVYTAFTFLGASGWAYSRGAPAFYIIAYGAIAYIISFFLLPALWRVGKARGLHTQPDFFLVRYGSQSLAALVAFIGVVSIVPYLQLQLQSLGFIVEIASAGAIHHTIAIIVAFGATTVFVYVSGLKGAAWVAVIKDVAMIVAVVVIGIGLPTMYFGGIGPMLSRLVHEHAAHLTFPGSTPNMGVGWAMSTIALTGCGFYCWPHQFLACFSAKDANTLRRNAVIMPLYQLPILLIFFVGFTAFMVMPGLKNGDTALLALVTRSYPAWFAGFVGAAGAVTAMVPAAVLLLAASSLVTKNVYKPLRRSPVDDAHLMRVARVMTLVIAAVALVLAIWSPNELVFLLIFGYDGVSQFFPGIVLGLLSRRAAARHVIPGLVAGEAVVVWLIASHNDPFHGLNAGFVGLAVNVVIVLVSTIVVPRATPARATVRP